MRYIWIAITILFLSFGVYSYTQINELKQEVNSLQVQVTELREAVEMLKKQSLSESHFRDVQLYFIRSTPVDFLLVPVTRSLPDSQDLPLHALQLLIEGPLPEENLDRSIPVETKVLDLTLEEGVAIVDFSEELSTKFVGGSQLESHLVSAIVFTLTQFPEIEQVQILIEGENVESIGGHITIGNPLP